MPHRRSGPARMSRGILWSQLSNPTAQSDHHWLMLRMVVPSLSQTKQSELGPYSPGCVGLGWLKVPDAI